MTSISDAALNSRFRGIKLPMPSVTLRDLLEDVLPEGAFLVSGSPDTRINWARTVTTQPNSVSSAVQGELILVSLETLQKHDDPERELARLITNLAQTRIQALCIQGTVSILTLRSAARNEIAVLYLPEDISIERAEQGIVNYIDEKQITLKQRDEALQNELIRQASSNANLSATLKVLANAVDLPIVLHDAHGLRLAHGLPDKVSGNAERWKQHFEMLADSRLVAHFTNQSRSIHPDSSGLLESEQTLTIALSMDSDTIGYLSVVKDDGAVIDDFTNAALTRGALVCSMVLAKQRTLDTLDSRRTDWISAWLNSYNMDDPMLAARAEQEGFSHDQVYVIVVIRWIHGDSPKRGARTVKPEQLTEQVRHEVQVRRINAIVGQYVDRTVLFLPLEKAQHTGRMKQYAISICERLTELLGGKVISGVGRPGEGLATLRRSFFEAEKALTLTDQIGDETLASFFGDLSLSELLMHVVDYQHLYRFCLDWLSDILAYDQQNNSDLLLTMSVYFANNGNMAATAKQLNVHRNTLVYRLNRIAEITQLDMDDADVQLNLHLAIKAYTLLKRLNLN
jgi:purine catabolism regulator